MSTCRYLTFFAMVGSQQHRELERLVRLSAPSDIGYPTNGRRLIINHTTIDLARSASNKLVFCVRVLHQDPVESGTETRHEVVCKLSPGKGLDVRVSGSNRHGAKEALGDAYLEWLSESQSNA